MKVGLKDLFSRDRKILYMILSIVLISIFSLTIVYAALNTVLNITGNAEVVASSWDVYLDNIQLINGSATTTKPTITNKTTASFTTTLTNPGDYYMFTIDVVNNGTIDAMIDSIEKIPTLTEQQTKYLNYIVEYQNGESISTKQLVEAKSFVRLKVKVEYRKDISSTDLPTMSETLNLSFKVNYVQSDDGNKNAIINNNGKLINIVSGDFKMIGSEICIGTECFYVISSDEDSVKMLAKRNITIDNTPKQNVDAPKVVFSSINYWYDGTSIKPEYGTDYPVYVYDNNSVIYNYVEKYKTYLESEGVNVEEARLITMDELETLGCDRENLSCKDAPNWIYRTNFWSGEAFTDKYIWGVWGDGVFSYIGFKNNVDYGVRPVIVLKI